MGYKEYSRGLRTQPCGAPMFRVIELEVNWADFHHLWSGGEES